MNTATIKDWRDYPNGKEKYQLYLASREWAVLKEKVRARSKGRCERCFDDTAANVHHQSYERIYQERLDDLVHVCIPCHEFLSGKRGDDPFLSSPVLMHGRRVRTVYIAGKITGTTWRDEVVPGWSQSVNRDVAAGRWTTSERCVPIPDGRFLDFAGPFWRPLEPDHHHWCGSSADVEALHAYCDDDLVEHHNDACGGEIIFRMITESIARSDLIFAWIDRFDSYGTLVELGYAKALNKLIYVAMPLSFHGNDDDLWIAHQAATVLSYYDSPGEAWKRLLSADRLGRLR